MAVVGKAIPDLSVVLVSNPKVKTTLKKLLADPKNKGKPVAFLFASAKLDPEHTKAAVASMEEKMFSSQGKASFIIVNFDTPAEAKALHDLCAIRNCTHVVAAAPPKALGVTRSPHHIVVDAKGIVKYTSDAGTDTYASFAV